MTNVLLTILIVFVIAAARRLELQLIEIKHNLRDLYRRQGTNQ